ncbi:hypothetical protein [Methylobacterium sp. OT2]|uniref:hypothetical protein n=1 Tax=Methylobacterium sp. OT2 TaxID=2813779 RepID=UPI00197C4B87|nr:hypothetical protein [Methylobacterium sp. OT2]MBN4095673.1 hypothetical protein [Methylobacterium sp. OT2]
MTKRTMNSNILHETFRSYPGTFRSAIEILHASEIKNLNSLEAIFSNNETARTYYLSFLDEISSVQLDSRSALFYQLLLNAASIFARRDCRIPVREEILTGLLRGAIGFCLDAINAESKFINPNHSRVRIFAADLNVNNRESRTGGDIAFMFDISEDKNRYKIIPVCFQSKRSNPQEGRRQCIRRTNKTDKVGNHQLERLSELAKDNINCAYLFYNNDQDAVIRRPILPVVKTVQDILLDIEQLDVNLEINTSDLASYIVHLINNEKNVISDAQSLEDAATLLVERSIDQIVVISSNMDMVNNLKLVMGNLEEEDMVAAPSSGPVNFKEAFSQSSTYADLYRNNNNSDTPTM